MPFPPSGTNEYREDVSISKGNYPSMSYVAPAPSIRNYSISSNLQPFNTFPSSVPTPLNFTRDEVKSVDTSKPLYKPLEPFNLYSPLSGNALKSSSDLFEPLEPVKSTGNPRKTKVCSVM